MNIQQINKKMTPIRERAHRSTEVKDGHQIPCSHRKHP